MLLRFLLILGFLFPALLRADIDINAGLSGSWHDPEVDGQGLLIDVVSDQSNLFAAWFTFSDAPPSPGAPEQQRWYTMFGPFENNSAQMTLFRVTEGRLDTPLDVNTAPAGQATLLFHSCTSATFEYQIDEPSLAGRISLERLSPDVSCQAIVDAATGASEPNYPPVVEALSVSDTGGGIFNITYAVSDPENDLLDVQVEIIGPGEQRYRVRESLLTGDVGYPVDSGVSKTIQWRSSDDPNLAGFGFNSFRVEVIADDRFVATMQDIVDLVSTERLVADVRSMEGVRHHVGNPVNLQATRDYIQEQMESSDLPVEQQLFTWQGSQGVNIIASLAGRVDNGGYYAIDGHYDTVTTTPGADDNASGTSGMLEAMRVLSQFNTETEIRFIGFDKEELGLRGARHYAANIPPGETVLGLINLEMIGYTCRGEAECINFPNADTAVYNIRSSFATELSDVFVTIGDRHVPGLKIVSVFDDGDPNFRRSDHAPFWDIGVDALMISDGANFRTPHYHQVSDSIETFDLEFMTGVVKTAVGALATVAGATHTGSQISELITLN